jgi:hypothetical protein
MRWLAPLSACTIAHWPALFNSNDTEGPRLKLCCDPSVTKKPQTEQQPLVEHELLYFWSMFQLDFTSWMRGGITVNQVGAGMKHFLQYETDEQEWGSR